MPADIASTLNSWSTTESSNSPAGSTVIGTNLDDNLRQIQAVVRTLAASNTLTAAAALNLASVNEAFITLTGSPATITSLGTLTAGMYKWVIFNAAHTLTHNATSLILPTAANITTANGDVAMFVSLGSGNWRCLSYMRASGGVVSGAVTSFADGSVSLPGIAFASEPDCGFYRVTTNTIGLSAGGAEVARFSTTGLSVSGGFSVNLGDLTDFTTSVKNIELRAQGTNASNSTATGGHILLRPGAYSFSSSDDGAGYVRFYSHAGNAYSGVVVSGATGMLCVDSNGTSARPTITSGGGTNPTITGTDNAFRISLGTSPGSTPIEVTFKRDVPGGYVAVAQYEGASNVTLRTTCQSNSITITPSATMSSSDGIHVIIIGIADDPD